MAPGGRPGIVQEYPVGCELNPVREYVIPLWPEEHIDVGPERVPPVMGWYTLTEMDAWVDPLTRKATNCPMPVLS